MSTELDGFLAERSSLTKRQIECLSLHVSAQNRVRNPGKEVRPHVIAGASEGAYYRVVGQAKNNVTQAVYTMLLCSRMGLVSTVDLQRLLGLLSKVPPDTSDASKEVMSLIEALVRKIVML
jgi:hypothetical protein